MAGKKKDSFDNESYEPHRLDETSISSSSTSSSRNEEVLLREPLPYLLELEQLNISETDKDTHVKRRNKLPRFTNQCPITKKALFDDETGHALEPVVQLECLHLCRAGALQKQQPSGWDRTAFGDPKASCPVCHLPEVSQWLCTPVPRASDAVTFWTSRIERVLLEWKKEQNVSKSSSKQHYYEEVPVPWIRRRLLQTDTTLTFCEKAEYLSDSSMITTTAFHQALGHVFFQRTRDREGVPITRVVPTPWHWDRAEEVLLVSARAWKKLQRQEEKKNAAAIKKHKIVVADPKKPVVTEWNQAALRFRVGGNKTTAMTVNKTTDAKTRKGLSSPRQVSLVHQEGVEETEVVCRGKTEALSWVPPSPQLVYVKHPTTPSATPHWILNSSDHQQRYNKYVDYDENSLGDDLLSMAGDEGLDDDDISYVSAAESLDTNTERYVLPQEVKAVQALSLILFLCCCTMTVLHGWLSFPTLSINPSSNRNALQQLPVLALPMTARPRQQELLLYMLEQELLQEMITKARTEETWVQGVHLGKMQDQDEDQERGKGQENYISKQLQNEKEVILVLPRRKQNETMAEEANQEARLLASQYRIMATWFQMNTY